MNIELKAKFNESYLPTPRCRKLRHRTAEKPLTIRIDEITDKNAPIAFIVTKGDDKTEYRFWDNKLWVKISWSEKLSGAHGLLPIEKLKNYLNVYDYWNYTEEQIQKEYEQLAKGYIIINGFLYNPIGEPRYVINTFGLGHNHGGTSLFVHNYYNSNISKNRYFNALKRKEVLKEAKNIALRRGDTDSVNGLEKANIKVLMPEVVRCNPEIKHGDGDPFINKIENVVNNTKNSFEAGLLAMMITNKELQEIT